MELVFNETKQNQYEQYVASIQAAVLKLNTTARQIACGMLATYEACLYAEGPHAVAEAFHVTSDSYIAAVSFIARQVGRTLCSGGHPAWEKLPDNLPSDSKVLGKLIAELIDANALPASQMARLSDPKKAAAEFRHCSTIKALEPAVQMFRNANWSYDYDFLEFYDVLQKTLGYWAYSLDPKSKMTIVPREAKPS